MVCVSEHFLCTSSALTADLPHFALASILQRLRRILPSLQKGRLRISCTEREGPGRRSSPEPLPLLIRPYLPGVSAAASSNSRAWPPGPQALACPPAVSCHTPLPCTLRLLVHTFMAGHRLLPWRETPFSSQSQLCSGSFCLSLRTKLPAGVLLRKPPWPDRPWVGTACLPLSPLCPFSSASTAMCWGLALSFHFRSEQVTPIWPIAEQWFHL